jgi:hypothetical protein
MKNQVIAHFLGLKTKTEVRDKIREFVNGYPFNTPIGRDDQAWLDMVLRLHYQYAAKVGAGIRHLEVRRNANHNGSTRGLWIVRVDGTEIDISWVVALMPGGRPKPKHDVSAAARYEIHPQIHHHHAQGPCGSCPLCDLPMQRRVNVHVDHAVPFDSLMDSFLANRGLDYADIEIEDLGLDSRFADRALAQTWQAHHQAKAQLRLTHAACNLARKAA